MSCEDARAAVEEAQAEAFEALKESQSANNEFWDAVQEALFGAMTEIMHGTDPFEAAFGAWDHMFAADVVANKADDIFQNFAQAAHDALADYCDCLEAHP